MAKKKDELESLVIALLKEKKEISVPEIAHVAGMSKSDEGDRKAIRRVLNGLVERGILEAHGAARARVYRALTTTEADLPKLHEDPQTFKDIPLSRESEGLLKHISQSLQARKPVGYNQDFLRLYEPNRTFYLTSTQRAELANTGTAEIKEQPAGTYARNILNRLLIDLSWNSSRLEGNTYSLLETKRLIEHGESASGKDAAEAQMILNHKGAIEYIVESVDEEKITSHEVCSIHALLSENLLGDPSASGRIRQIAVGVSGTNYLPLENPHLLKECFEIFIEKLNLIEDPFEQSFFSLVQLSYLQAFEDVNKRTARLVANIPLIKKNFRPLSFIDVNREAYIKSLLGVYEKNDVGLFRDLYLWAYTRSAQRYSALQQAMGEPNLLKLKYRSDIQEIIRTVILEKVAGPQVVHRVQDLIEEKKFSEADQAELFKLIELEIVSLHDGNIARFKIRPLEFQAWKSLQ
ncbi:MAG TPA: Fic family protein [Oligoflexus sp.]|uniref:Fic family protein n=1 Tax=Oligoflexus sp. TaxID=1971216 RepID=UPI002D23AD05|nr:Fic family protein [Oligoflexus sp.]HYX39426.1 Fic family protein [Oligoflexus sp.]